MNNLAIYIFKQIFFLHNINYNKLYSKFNKLVVLNTELAKMSRNEPK